ncbi:retron Ec78 anti-phage system effector HNH endonuclease PtuB [Pseudomonas paracarnis]|uniref:retron Ec78 anti-phage system effector HNH endonuclease PtuB n=1 Tax=Pseudomonas paracarnis TaxID=2750625 RepID=UPI00249C39BF|nr:retron Ec78 anti-phage system effector HNH endonuclease PtuB [Pseudomonas paracarnis]MDI3183250.1 TIGR02646 family protein [Pseudomonas paracarnis]
MHRLQRGPAPICLARHRHGRDNWSALDGADRTEIWQTLEAMQSRRCAYCEAAIAEGNRHIEHFVQKGRDPRVTFQWDNLFGSCNREDSCGKYKDHGAGAYKPGDLLKPDVDDPDHYFVFVADGTIQLRAGLNDTDRQRASETLRVFNLDAEHGALRHMRQRESAGYVPIAEELWTLFDEFPEDEWQQLLDDELAATTHLPFVSAIRHTLCRMS